MRRFSLALILTLLVSSAAQAHFAWLVCDKSDSGQNVKLYFSEVLSPGSADLVENFAKAKIVAVCREGKCHEIETKLVKDGDEGCLNGPIPTSADRCVEMEMVYGVHKNMLVNYFAKSLISSEETSTKPTDDSAPAALNIASKRNGSQLELTVTWKGEPVSGSRVMVVRPKAKSSSLSTDDAGRVQVELTGSGQHGFLAMHFQNEESGEYEGEKYTRVGHFSSLTMNVNADAPASEEVTAKQDEISATDLLAGARSTRNVWEDGFPGFSADVVVTVGTNSVEGKIEVNDEGKIKWTLPEGDNAKWAKSTLGSLVGHRIPAGDLGDKAAYVDEVRNHPLGRKISLVEDAMGSVYRVRNNTIRQVNRDAGPSRFKITVLAVQRDERKRYLPTVFSVASWNKKSGALDFSLIAKHTFQRVGSYDLPQHLVELMTGPKHKYEVKELTLSNLRLNTKEASAKEAASK